METKSVVASCDVRTELLNIQMSLRLRRIKRTHITYSICGSESGEDLECGFLSHETVYSSKLRVVLGLGPIKSFRPLFSGSLSLVSFLGNHNKFYNAKAIYVQGFFVA
jgi:hypothetical protein